jgi:hypothetical protein
MLSEIPMPPAVANRPRDARGYPVPAITPWVDGQPQFGLTGVARTFLCAVERRCSICGHEMAPGPVWRVVGGDEADAIAVAIDEGRPYRNAAPTAEAPGHRGCMLYAAMICPWLSRPTARRGQPVAAAEIFRGARRGHGGAVVGFQTYDFSYRDDHGVRFRFATVVDFLPHDLGAEHAAALRAALRQEAGDGAGPDGQAPPYLLADEEAAAGAFSAHLGRLLG